MPIKILSDVVPISTSVDVGGVKIGENLNIDNTGELNAEFTNIYSSGLTLFDTIERNCILKDEDNPNSRLAGSKVLLSEFPDAVNTIKADWESTTEFESVYAKSNCTPVNCTAANDIGTGFVYRGFLDVPEQRLGEADTWSMEVSFKYTYNAEQAIWGTGNSVDYKQPYLRIYGQKLCLFLSSTGTGWNLANNLTGVTTLVVGKWYHVKLTYTGTQYITTLTNLETEVTTTEHTLNNATKIFVSGYNHAFGNFMYNTSIGIPFWGHIRLSSIKFTKDNVTTFEGATFLKYKKAVSGRKIVSIKDYDLVQEYYNLHGNADFYIYDDVNNGFFYLPKESKKRIILEHRRADINVTKSSIYYTIWNNGWCECSSRLWTNPDNWNIAFPFKWKDTLYSLTGEWQGTDSTVNLGISAQYEDYAQGNNAANANGNYNWFASGFVDLDSIVTDIPQVYTYYFLANSQQPILLKTYSQQLQEYTEQLKTEIKSTEVVPIAMRPYVPYPVTDFTLMPGELNCDGQELAVWNDIKAKFEEYTASGGIAGGNPKGIAWVDFATYDQIKLESENVGCAYWGYDSVNQLLRTPTIMDETVVAAAITQNGYFQTLRDQMPSMLARCGYVASNSSWREQQINATEAWTANKYQIDTPGGNSDTITKGIAVVRNDTTQIRNKQVCYPWRINIANIYVPATEVQWNNFVDSLAGKADLSRISELSRTRVWVSDWISFSTSKSIDIEHNLNLTNPIMARYSLYLKCKAAAEGYIIGDILAIPPECYCNSNTVGVSFLIGTNTVHFACGSQHAFFVTNKTSSTYMSAANVQNCFDLCMKIEY